MNLLYVEDDPEARELVRRALEREGFAVDTAEDARAGLARARSRRYDLIILDVRLPGESGFELLARLRDARVDCGVLFLTAQGEVADRVAGLDLGADDYLSKPFALAELVARVHAIARRRLGEPGDGRIEVADLVLDVRRHAVSRAGRRIELAPKEFSLLEYLMRNQGHVVSRAMITEQVWGHGFQAYKNVIEVHVNRLRKKIEASGLPKLIHTSKGVGYVFEERDG